MQYLRIMIVFSILLVTAMGTSQAADVALFNNTSYVDYIVSSSNAEASNVEATLTSQGHTVTTFTGITATDFNNAVAGRDVLVIPELENGDLNAALDAAARTAIANFVNNGGIFIGFLPSGDMTSLMNAIFGFSLVGSSGSAPYVLNAAGAAGTPFQGGPPSLPYLSGTLTVTQASLPAGTKIIYNTGTDVAVFMAPFGSGWVILIGWDWFNAMPVGSEDGGWLSVLDAAVNADQRTTAAVPTMNEWGMIIFMIAAGIFAGCSLRRRKA